jgi:parallel beta-helix repeat protein
LDNVISSNIQNGLYLYNSHKNNIAFNNISSNGYKAIEFKRSNENSIQSNDFYSNIGAAIDIIWTSYHSIITGNYITNNGGGIYSHFECKNNTVTDNHIYNNGGNAIYIGENSRVINNRIINCTSGIIIHSDSLVKGNTVALSNFSGITFDISCRGSTAIFNNIYSNNISGVVLFDCFENNVMSNIISDNRYGIHMYGAQDATIIGNTISSNTDYGIYVADYSFNVKVYHNNLINNSKQAYDEPFGTSKWDNGYPSGGNFWSDYVGVDEKSGPNQNLSGSDGIGDTPHDNSSGYRYDRYPLMRPYQNHIRLNEGWNLISLPLLQSDQNLTKVLENIDGYYDAVQWHDNTDSTNPWKHHKIGKPFGNDLHKLNETMSFWIHITQPGATTFLYNGTQPISNQTIGLQKGWNMVGYPSLTNHNRTVGLNNLEFGKEIDAIQWFDSSTKTWNDMGGEDSFEIGDGYWIHAKTDCVWEVPL